MNAVEILLRPDGLRPVVENREEVGTWMIRRLRAEAILEVSDDRIGALLDQTFPPMLTIRFCKADVHLSLFSMIATMGTPLDVSLQDLRLEFFFPADDATAAWFQQA